MLRLRGIGSLCRSLRALNPSSQSLASQYMTWCRPLRVTGIGTEEACEQFWYDRQGPTARFCSSASCLTLSDIEQTAASTATDQQQPGPDAEPENPSLTGGVPQGYGRLRIPVGGRRCAIPTRTANGAATAYQTEGMVRPMLGGSMTTTLAGAEELTRRIASHGRRRRQPMKMRTRSRYRVSSTY